MTALTTLETKSNIAFLNINRPEVKNALNLSCINELTEAVKKINGDMGVKCLVLSGTGNEAFCSGADLKELADKKTLDEKSGYFEALAGLVIAIRECEKPVIAKVHGYALAGGLSLIAASDIVFAANNAKFALPELKVGMVPGIVMLALEEVISKRALNYLSMSADVIDAEEALQIGLVSKVYGKSVLDEKTFEFAKEISGFSKSALSTTKTMLLSNSNASLKQKLSARARDMATYSLSADCVEGIDAYLNKKKASWK